MMISCSGKIRSQHREIPLESSRKRRGRPKGSKTKSAETPRRDLVKDLDSKRYPRVPVELSNRLQSAAREMVRNLLKLLQELYERGIEENLLALVEFGIPDLLAKFGQEIITAQLEQERGYFGPRIKDCEGTILEYQGERPTTVLTSLGDVSFRRSYYTGPSGTLFPLDQLLGIEQHAVLPGLQELVGLFSSRMSYPQATDSLNRALPLNISLKRVENITQSIAEVVQDDQSERIERAYSAACPLPTISKNQVTVLEVDGGMCPVRDDEENHREFKLAAVGRLDGDDIVDKHYVGHFGEPDNLFKHLTTDFFELGHAGASHLHVVSDGAAWIWNRTPLLKQEGQKFTAVLDYYHVSERLTKLMRALFTESEAMARKAILIDHLFEGRQTEFHSTLEEWCRHPSTDAKEVVDENLTYFNNNRGRLDYKACQDAGLPIGSGAIEGGIRFIGKDRLDGTGMRWKVPGAERILQLRCLDASRLWDSFWSVRRDGRKQKYFSAKKVWVLAA